jgi:hypothetical protein
MNLKQNQPFANGEGRQNESRPFPDLQRSPGNPEFHADISPSCYNILALEVSMNPMSTTNI